MNQGMSLLHRGGIFSAARRLRQPRISFLMYHGLTDRPLSEMEAALGLHAPVSQFENVCRFLAKSRLAMSMAEAVEILQNKAPARHGVVLTFDDGYRSNHKLAFPVLKRHQIPATIFLATEFVHSGGYLWPDRISYALEHTTVQAFQYEMREGLVTISLRTAQEKISALGALCGWLKSLPQERLLHETVRIENLLGTTLSSADTVPDIYQPMTWAQALEMQQSGLVEFGAHTHHHRILARCSPENMERELSVNIELMASHLGQKPRFFAYPNGQEGDFDRRTREMLQKFGFAAAVTTVEGRNLSGRTDLLAIQRFGEGRSPAQVEFLASGLIETLQRRPSRPVDAVAQTNGKIATA
jgi:peptidoglycan/xylan/chitin deacetylase (PgdA/CDA1 family)